MARQRLETREVLELVLEDGSDDDVDIGFEDHDNDDNELDDTEILDIGNLETEESFIEPEVDLDSRDAVDTQQPSSDPESDTESTVDPPLDPDSSDNEVIPPTPPRNPVDLDPDQDDDQPTPSPRPTEEEINDLIFDDPGATEWVHNLENYPVNPPFTGNSGFQIPIPDDATPLFFYELFITDQIIKLIKRETNRYAASTCRAARRRNPNLSRRSFFNQWKTVTEADIRKFLPFDLHGACSKTQDQRLLVYQPHHGLTISPQTLWFETDSR